MRCKPLKVCIPRLLSNKKLPRRMRKAFCSDRHNEKNPSDGRDSNTLESVNSVSEIIQRLHTQ